MGNKYEIYLNTFATDEHCWSVRMNGQLAKRALSVEGNDADDQELVKALRGEMATNQSDTITVAR